MRGFLLGLSLSVAFVLGCVAAPLIVPPLSAQQAAAGVQRWENMCADVDSSSQSAINDVLARFGSEGWELVNGDRGRQNYCFKRPLL